MKEYSLSKVLKLMILLLFILVNIDIIISGISQNSNITLGFPYYMFSEGKYLLAFERAPIASRVTIIIIALIGIDYYISILLSKYKK